MIIKLYIFPYKYIYCTHNIYIKLSTKTHNKEKREES